MKWNATPAHPLARSPARPEYDRRSRTEGLRFLTSAATIFPSLEIRHTPTLIELEVTTALEHVRQQLATALDT